MKKICILLGGIFGGDGWVNSRGMIGLANQLIGLGYPVTTFTWDKWEQAKGSDIIIGYSGGGSRATWFANTGVLIDLMVLYDPSPSWQMEPIGKNVKQAVCYFNTSPMMFGLGGGMLKGAGDITIIKISEQHLAVQYDQALHTKTLKFVKAL